MPAAQFTFLPDASDEQMSALHQQMQETLERCRVEAEEAFSKDQVIR